MRARLSNVRSPAYGIVHTHREGRTLCGIAVRPTWRVTADLPTCRRCLAREVNDSQRPFLEDGVGQEIEGI